MPASIPCPSCLRLVTSPACSLSISSILLSSPSPRSRFFSPCSPLYLRLCHSCLSRTPNVASYFTFRSSHPGRRHPRKTFNNLSNLLLLSLQSNPSSRPLRPRNCRCLVKFLSQLPNVDVPVYTPHNIDKFPPFSFWSSCLRVSAILR
jgi:hypothetical protein